MISSDIIRYDIIRYHQIWYHQISSKSLSHSQDDQDIPRCSMVLVYFTYMTGWFCSGKCWCAYISTMEHPDVSRFFRRIWSPLSPLSPPRGCFPHLPYHPGARSRGHSSNALQRPGPTWSMVTVWASHSIQNRYGLDVGKPYRESI